MEPLVKTCGHTLNKLLQLLTMPVHRPIAHNEVLASFKDLKQSYSAIVEELLNTASLNWNFVTLLLCNISTLQKVFSTLLTNPSPLSSACLSIFSVKTFLIDLLHFNDCDEKILRHAAQNCFTVLFICLKKSTNSENFEETLNYALNQICHKEKIFLCRCRHLELITVLLKQFRVQRMELCGWFWEQFIPELCHTEFKNAENYKEGESCHALLKFLCEILNTEHPVKERLDSYPQFCKSLASMNEYIFSLMHFVDLCMMNVSYRLLYFQVIAACLKYLPQDENTWSVKQPRIVLKAMANAKLVGYFQKEPKFVGFGSRQRVDDKEKTDITCGFSPAEKMLLLNNLLSACQLVAKLQNDIEVMSSTETIMFGLLSAFEPKDFVSKVFEIYIEQDDMMIEFLQLYLNNFLMAERLGKTFLVSPHHLFVELLQKVAFDSSVLLDWLTSNETQFLSYYLKYLKYLANNFSAFVFLCDSIFERSAVNSVITTLKCLRSSIEKLISKDLFPYSVAPLLKVMSTVESLGSHVLGQ